MTDQEIINLFIARDENAITKIQLKCAKVAKSIAFNILHNNQDTEECLNDGYLRLWNSIPPHIPENLSAYFLKIIRNLALKKYEYYHAQKRGNGEIELALEELEDCFIDVDILEQQDNQKELAQAISSFLKNQSSDHRIIFVKRYWYLSSVKDIAKELGYSESKVKSCLFRTRNSLKEYLTEKELY